MKRNVFLLCGLLMTVVSCEKPVEIAAEKSDGKSAKSSRESLLAVPGGTAKKQEDGPVSEENTRTGPNPRPPRPVYPKPTHPVALQVEGQPGMVISPYGGKIVDVRNIPPGTLVQDPTAQPEDKAYFRVPGP